VGPVGPPVPPSVFHDSKTSFCAQGFGPAFGDTATWAITGPAPVPLVLVPAVVVPVVAVPLVDVPVVVVPLVDVPVVVVPLVDVPVVAVPVVDVPVETVPVVPVPVEMVPVVEVVVAVPAVPVPAVPVVVVVAVAVDAELLDEDVLVSSGMTIWIVPLLTFTHAKMMPVVLAVTTPTVAATRIARAATATRMTLRVACDKR